jgi:hypothetical protein
MKAIISALTLATILMMGALSATEKPPVNESSSAIAADESARDTDSASKGGLSSIGREVGDAVSESLAAISVETNKFSETPLGSGIVTVVFWKIMWKELVKVVIGIGILIMMTFLLRWGLRAVLVGTIVQTGVDASGKPSFEFIRSESKGDDQSCSITVMLVVYVIIFLVTVFGLIA